MGFTENAPVENALATIGAVLWTIQIIPQIVKSYREKSTKGLSGELMLIWGVASWFLGAYIVSQRLSIPLQVQPQAFGFLSGLSWVQTLYYSKGYSKKKAGLCLLAFCLLFAAFETGSVYALWAGQDRGVYWPTTMYGGIAAFLLAIALLPEYIEIYKLKEVIGISLVFMAVDVLGGIFSFSSLFFRNSFDITAFISYALVVVLDTIVVILAFILNPRAKRRREREQGLCDPESAGHSVLPTPSTTIEADSEASASLAAPAAAAKPFDPEKISAHGKHGGV